MNYSDDERMVTVTRKAALITLCALSVVALLISLLGCSTCPAAKPCPPPPAPISYPVPVFQPCEPPPPIAAPSDRVGEVPGEVRELANLTEVERAARFTADPALLDKVLDWIVYAVLQDLDSCRSAWTRANDMLNIYRQRAGVPMMTTESPLPPQ